MDCAIPDGSLNEYEELIAELALPDPDVFVENLFDFDAAAIAAAAQRQWAQLKNPPIVVDRYLENLIRQDLVLITKALASYRTTL